MDLTGFSAIALAKKIQAKEISVEEAVRDTLAQIEKKEPDIHSFITVDAKGALAQAREVQKKIDAGSLTGALAGVPIAVKDNLCTKGLLTTCGSKMLSDFVPAYTAEAVQRLKHAGMVVVGKTNMDEFAMGSTTETSYYGPTKNPWSCRAV